METIKVEFEDGSWWEIVSVYTVGMAKAVATMQANVVNVEEIKDAVDNDKPVPMMRDAEGNDLTFQITQALVLSATRAWSYGEVTISVLNEEIPLVHYYEVARRIDEQSSSLPLVRK